MLEKVKRQQLSIEMALSLSQIWASSDPCCDLLIDPHCTSLLSGGATTSTSLLHSCSFG